MQESSKEGSQKIPRGKVHFFDSENGYEVLTRKKKIGTELLHHFKLEKKTTDADIISCSSSRYKLL